MPTMDLNRHEGLHPVAAFVLSTLELGRGNLLRQIQELTPDQLAAKPEGFKNSIATLLVHIAATEVNFCHRIIGKPVPEELKVEFLLDQPHSPLPAPVGATVENLTARLEKSLNFLRETLQGLTEIDLTRVIPFGPDRGGTVQWMLALLAGHQAQHVGHIQLLRGHV